MSPSRSGRRAAPPPLRRADPPPARTTRFPRAGSWSHRWAALRVRAHRRGRSVGVRGRRRPAADHSHSLAPTAGRRSSACVVATRLARLACSSRGRRHQSWRPTRRPYGRGSLSGRSPGCIGPPRCCGPRRPRRGSSRACPSRTSEVPAALPEMLGGDAIWRKVMVAVDDDRAVAVGQDGPVPRRLYPDARMLAAVPCRGAAPQGQDLHHASHRRCVQFNLPGEVTVQARLPHGSATDGQATSRFR